MTHHLNEPGEASGQMREKVARGGWRPAKSLTSVSNAVFQRERTEGHVDGSRCRWRDASLNNMYLTRLVRVSLGSWQPEILVAQAPSSA